MSAFEKLKKASSFESLSNKLKESESKGGNKDLRYWSPTVDEKGIGSATIRFLPNPPGLNGDPEPTAYVKKWSHTFKGPGGWYIENSLTTIGKEDPCSEYHKQFWSNDPTEAMKNELRPRNRKLHYIANIYVIKDKGNPDNEGKNFLYAFGSRIFDKIKEAMHPSYDDVAILNPFDMHSPVDGDSPPGANFVLRIKNVDDQRNYGDSGFDRPGPLFKTEEEAEALWLKTYSLQEEISEKNFKAYDVLQKRLFKVLGIESELPSKVSEDPTAAPKKMKEKAAPSEPVIEDDDDFDLKSLMDDDDIPF
jgi:hypothetical protein